MTTQEKNIEIALMLGWNDKEGDFLLPKSLEANYDYREWCGTKNAHIQEDWMVTPEQQYDIAPGNLNFHSDANWQFEAIDWIEKLKIGKDGYAYFQIVKNNIWIYVYKNHTNHCPASFSGVEHPKATKKEAIFEALYQFSQYLKQKR